MITRAGSSRPCRPHSSCRHPPPAINCIHARRPAATACPRAAPPRPPIPAPRRCSRTSAHCRRSRASASTAPGRGSAAARAMRRGLLGELPDKVIERHVGMAQHRKGGHRTTEHARPRSEILPRCGSEPGSASTNPGRMSRIARQHRRRRFAALFEKSLRKPRRAKPACEFEDQRVHRERGAGWHANFLRPRTVPLRAQHVCPSPRPPRASSPGLGSPGPRCHRDGRPRQPASGTTASCRGPPRHPPGDRRAGARLGFVKRAPATS